MSISAVTALVALALVAFLDGASLGGVAWIEARRSVRSLGVARVLGAFSAGADDLEGGFADALEAGIGGTLFGEAAAAVFDALDGDWARPPPSMRAASSAALDRGLVKARAR